MAFEIALDSRIRRSPFFDATVAEGVTQFSTYNNMYMPTSYGDPLAEYWRLVEGVAMWDVAVERQIELRGPDAARLAQILSPRKVARMEPDQGRYVPVCNHRGWLINDPILLRLDEDRFWFSIADSDLILWAHAIAAERRLDVEVFEPDVSPLAVQGPKAGAVVAELAGAWVTELKRFCFRKTRIGDIPVRIAHSGWSHQGGFEIYLEDGRRGGDLWEMVREAGKPHGIGPGTPNQMERIEAGLLSYGSDTDERTSPFEVRLGRYVDLDLPNDVVGIDALRREAEAGSSRHQIGIVFAGAAPVTATGRRHTVLKDGREMGEITSMAFSPRLHAQIGLCLVSRELVAGEAVTVALPDGTEAEGEMRELPFI